MDEAEIACGGFVVSGCDAPGILQLVDASLDQVAKGVDEIVDGHLHLSALAHGNDCGAAALFDILSNAISVIAPISQQHLRVQPAVHHGIVALVVRDLSAGDLGFHGQAAAVGSHGRVAGVVEPQQVLDARALGQDDPL